ncbi:MAG: fused response regulator/phosphatase [Turneriella sp.]
MEKSILLIDDENDIRKLLAMILTPIGYTVFEAQNGAEALQVLRNTTVSLILTDQNMPVMDGLAFLAALRSDLNSDVPVLMMSGDTSDDLRRRCYALGVYDFINKPESPDILLARVENGFKIAALQLFEKNMKHDLRVSAAILKRIATPASVMRPKYHLMTCRHSLIEVGGDICIALGTDSPNPVFIIGDITGHGISAALFAIFVDVAVRRAHREALLPHKILTRLNRELSEYLPASYFVSMFCFTYDAAKGLLLYANAGHPAPHARVGGVYTSITAPRHPVLGVNAYEEYSTESMRVSPGDWLLCYTDGVLDTFDGTKYKVDLHLTDIAQAGKNAGETYALAMEHLSAQQGISDDRTIMLFTVV